jgi:sirohydrochlorin ferrochelatase
MTRRCFFLPTFLLLAGGAHAAASPAMPSPMTLQGKSFGVLLLGIGGGRDWQDALAAMAKAFARQFPLEFAGGSADVKTIQEAVNRLEGERIKKIVVVPLYAASRSPLMEQTRFLFGIRQDPAPEFFTAAHLPSGYALVRRVQFQGKLPVVLTTAPDDDPLVVDILTSRALKLSKHPDGEALVLVGLAPAAAPLDKTVLGQGLRPKPPTIEEEYRQLLSSLAERVRARGAFKSAQAAVLQPYAQRQADREHHDAALRSLVRELSRSQRVLVVPYAVTGGEAAPIIMRALQGTFMRFNDKGLLPDDRMVRWVADTIRRGATLPDMRVYKDAGRPLPGRVKPMSVKLLESHQ